MQRFHNLRRLLVGGKRWSLLLIVALALCASAQTPSPVPTFLIFKYQHTVGSETDQCNRDTAGTRCHAHFQLAFTDSSIALDADIQTGPSLQPISYSAKGQNSTRSFLDLSITIDGQ